MNLPVDTLQLFSANPIQNVWLAIWDGFHQGFHPFLAKVGAAAQVEKGGVWRNLQVPGNPNPQ